MELTGKRILVVEDEVLIAMMIEDTLSDAGVIVVGPASNIADALKLVDTAEIDAGFLDVNLNGLPSHIIGDALRARGIPFVYATGYDKRGAVGKVDAPVIAKPFGAEQVIWALEQVLNPTVDRNHP